MTDFRALCAELVEKLDDLNCNYNIPNQSALIERARAALAQPEPEGPTDEELLRTYGLAKRDHNYEGPIDDWPKRAERAATVAGIRAVLARWGRPTPQPTAEDSSVPQPSDGEVTELVAWLRELGAKKGGCFDVSTFCANLARAAALLERLMHYEQALSAVMPSDFKDWWQNSKDEWPDVAAGVITSLRGQEQLAWEQLERLSPPQPIPVSERLPGPGDCDAEGRCWLCGKVERDWRLINPDKSGVPQLKYCFSHWLPAYALPVPTND